MLLMAPAQATLPPGRLVAGRWRWRLGAVALGQPEEQILERRQFGRQREDAHARLSERHRQLAHVGLLCLERDSMFAREGVLDARPGAHRLQCARVVGGAQPVARSALAAQVRERALVDDAPAIDDRDAVAQFLHLRELVAGEQHRDAFAGEAADQLAHVAHAGRVEAGRGLVEDQQARAPQQRRGDPQPLAHPMRVATHLVLGTGSQLYDREHLVDARGCAVAVEPGQQLEVLASGQVRVEPRCLHEPGDALQRPRAHTQRVMPEQLHRALARHDQAERHAQRRRLARPVGPQEPVHVSRTDVQVDVIDREHVLVALHQSSGADRRRLVVPGCVLSRSCTEYTKALPRVLLPGPTIRSPGRRLVGHATGPWRPLRPPLG